MLFIDQNNLIDQRKLSKLIDDLKVELDRYDGEIANLEGRYKAMHDESERFAREKFYLHKKDELVFVIERPEKERN